MIDEVEHSSAPFVDGWFSQGRWPDGRRVKVEPLLYGRARLGIGPLPPMEDIASFDIQYEFPTLALAMSSFYSWDPTELPEPLCWDCEPVLRLYRIKGNEDLEYVKISQDQPIEQEIIRAVQVSQRIPELALESITESSEAWVQQLVDHTRCWTSVFTHERRKDAITLFMDTTEKRECTHHYMVIVRFSRCVVLSVENLALMQRRPAYIENLVWRLTKKLNGRE